MDIESEIITLFKGKKREAPALCKKDGIYYLITSACTGWVPNQAMYSTSKSIKGPWSELKSIGDRTTFGSQSTYILPVTTLEGVIYIFCADRWNEEKLDESEYICLPLKFINDKLELSWYNEWSLSNKTSAKY